MEIPANHQFKGGAKVITAVDDGRSHVSRSCGSLILPALEHPQPVCYH
jgi:hypothetical protein